MLYVWGAKTLLTIPYKFDNQFRGNCEYGIFICTKFLSLKPREILLPRKIKIIIGCQPLESFYQKLFDHYTAEKQV